MSAICYLLMFRWQGTCESFEKTTKYSKSWIMGPKHEAPWNPPAQERGSGWIFQTGSNSDDEVHGMAQDSNGNIIVAGETQVERWCFKNFLGKLSEAIPLRYFLFLCVCFFFQNIFLCSSLIDWYEMVWPLTQVYFDMDRMDDRCDRWMFMMFIVFHCCS